MISENNIVSVTGKVVSRFKFDHEAYKEKFYTANVEIVRLSGNVDTIPVMVSERLLDLQKNYMGEVVNVTGEFRSFNYYDGDKTHLLLRIFAKQLEFSNEFDNSTENNLIQLDGFICTENIYRKTPLGRKIANLMLAVNRSYKKTDYIPCIAWNRDAKWIYSFPVGTRIKASGRIQSREYKKKIGDRYEIRTAYEVSIRQMEVVEGEN